MKYIANTGKLAKILNVLSNKDQCVREFFFSELKSRMMSYPDQSQRIRTLFLLSNAERMGANPQNIEEATKVYLSKSDAELDSLRNMSNEKAHESYLQFL